MQEDCTALPLATKAPEALPAAKFADPDWTAKGEPRAVVPLAELRTLWINTGTLCNITCSNCYIESSPTNDRLVYITAAEVAPFLEEALALGTREIGFTGGEPFMNPEFLDMLADALERGFEALVLTNAMQPMRRPHIERGLVELKEAYGRKLTLRVSLDHHMKALHETERGAGTWDKAIEGLDWLSSNGVRLAIAGRTCWGEDEAQARAGYARLFAAHGWDIDAHDPGELTLFPEMDGAHDVPEITTSCWDILKKSPRDVMCASSRMVVKRKEAAAPVVLPCTLLPYDSAFEMGPTLHAASTADGGMFSHGAVKLCHPHCARFCVLGGGSCS
jgi:sulfatase maturation enzyme AslB (radical SAM superfamily)